MHLVMVSLSHNNNIYTRAGVPCSASFADLSLPNDGAGKSRLMTLGLFSSLMAKDPAEKRIVNTCASCG